MINMRILIYMKTFLLILIQAGLLCYSSLAQQSAGKAVRQRINMDDSWQFTLNPDENKLKENAAGLPWRTVNLPHDWSIEGSYSENNGDWQSGYLPAGIGIYQKILNVPQNWLKKEVSITFDGVYMNSEVWINGHLLGKRPNGNLGFTYSLSKFLKEGRNVIRVKADHSKPLSARWYTGSGIYRHVWLNVTDKTRVNQENIQVISNLSSGNADVNVKFTLENGTSLARNILVKKEILNPLGEVVASASHLVKVTAGSNPQTSMFKIEQPMLWGIEKPQLYKIKLSLIENNRVIDNFLLNFGIRKTDFSGAWGFKLNGEPLKIKGMCMHQEAGPFGSAIPDEVLLARLKQLKNIGLNAIRTSHNPFSPEFYNLCDSLGIMVLNEAFDGWEIEKARDDYGNYFEDWWEKDVTDFILRDRNHPSVIMWSLGNEVRKPTLETQQKLLDLFHRLDPGRPVTQGGVDPTRGMKGDTRRTQLDIMGFNGDGEEIGIFEEFHAKFPEVPVIATEVPHTYQTRGIYKTITHWRRHDFPAPWEIKSGQAGTMKGLEGRVFPIENLSEKEVFPESTTTKYFRNGAYFDILNPKPWARNLYYQSSYDNASVRSSARKAWQRTLELPYVMGQFRWTAFDYLGESNQWPSRMANFGIIDVCGFPKDHYYLYKSLWTDNPMVHILPHWTHPGKEDQIIPMVVYTNCDSVNLSLNGNSLGTKKYSGEQLIWQVPYQAGKLKAVGYRNGVAVSNQEVQTAGKPTNITIKATENQMKADGKDVLLCEITVTDANGNPVPGSEEVLEFTIHGPAKIKVTDNGDPLDLTDYISAKRKTFNGKCLVVLQSLKEKGTVRLEAKGKNLSTASYTFKSL